MPGPVATTIPKISGTATEGQLLTIGGGVWTNSPTSQTWQWQRCDAAGANPVAIPSSTGTSYLVASADVGKTIRCSTTAYNSVGASLVYQTAQTAVVSALTPAVPVIVTAPVVSGVAVRGNSLSVSNGAWTNSPTSYARQWRRCDTAGANCVDIAAATAAAYVLTATDVGKTVRCNVTASNATGASTPAASAATGVVVAPTSPVPHKGISLGGRSLNRSSTDRAFELDHCLDVAPGGVVRIDCVSISSQLDGYVDGIVARGMKPLLILGGSGTVFTDAAAFGASCSAMVTHYAARGVTLYETPNEPYIHGWTAAQYAAASRAAYDAVKAVNATYLVAMGAATGGNNGGHGVYDFYSVVIPLMQGKYDVFSVHAYDDPLDHWSGGGSQWDATFGDPTYFPNPNNIVSVMAASTGGVKPVWSTESGGPTPKYSEQAQANIATHGCADTRVKMYLWYTMLDDDVPGFGLLKPDRSQRLSYNAFKAAT